MIKTYKDILELFLRQPGQIYESHFNTVDDVEPKVRNAIDSALKNLWFKTDWKFREINKKMIITSPEIDFGFTPVVIVNELGENLTKLDYEMYYEEGKNCFFTDTNTGKTKIDTGEYIIFGLLDYPVLSSGGSKQSTFINLTDTVNILNEVVNEMFVNCLKDTVMVALLSSNDPDYSVYQSSFTDSLNTLYKYCGVSNFRQKEVNFHL
jgi:hypothetical protein